MDSNGKQEDRLSSLPDPLLIHILSFLPTPDAVKTMVIKPFGNLWSSLPNLDLNDSFFHWDVDNDPSASDLQMFRFARNLLMRHRNPKIDKFSVTIKDIFVFENEDRNLRPDVDSWINFALRKQVEVLIFSGYVDVLYEFPHSVFISDSLIDLKLESVAMKLPRRVHMRSLRILRLIRVNLNDEVLREIISGCPLLKELEIDNCWGFSELSFDAPNIEMLKLDSHENNFLRINCPNLMSFDFGGYVDCLEDVNLSSLIDLTFRLRCRIAFQALLRISPQFVAVLKKVLHVTVVSLSYFSSLVLFSCILKDIPKLLFNWKHIELSIWLAAKHISGLDHLLSNSTCLERLVIHLKTWPGRDVEPIESEVNSYEEGSWSCLKSITIHEDHDVSKSSYHLVVRLLEILLKKALVLDELVIYYPKKYSKFTSKELAGFSEKISTFSKASQHAKVLLLRSH